MMLNIYKNNILNFKLLHYLSQPMPKGFKIQFQKCFQKYASKCFMNYVK